MTRYRNFLVILSSAILTLVSVNQVQAFVLTNTPCKSIGTTKKSLGKIYVCTKGNSKLVWKLDKKNIKSTSKKQDIAEEGVPPKSKPNLEVSWEGKILRGTIYLPSNKFIVSDSLIGIQARLKFGPAPLSKNDSFAYISSGQTAVAFNWDLSSVWETLKSQPWKIYLEAELVNASGNGPSNSVFTSLPSIEITETPNQANARKAAEGYLASSPFSRIKLIEQLKYDGFGLVDAEYGVDALKTNWNEQAAKSARNYLDTSGFSYENLVAQLQFDGFTSAQSAFGADSTGLTKTISSPSPASSPTPVKTNESTKCSPQYLDPLPFSSQRIAVTEIIWEKDSKGYVYALASLRNDLSKALRLVEFSFSFFHELELVGTQTTLRGYHYFVKDDPSLNSFDKTPGAWLPGQVRQFKLESNKILDCSKIYIFGNRFVVSQGIGES